MQSIAKAQTNKKNIPQIDALKGIAIFLVVLGHSIIVFPINLHENPVCAYIYSWLSSVHMPLFFTISGLCFHYYGSYKEFLLKKVRRILIPYFIFNGIDLIVRILFSGYVNRTYTIGESIRRIFLLGGEYWFLYTLFFIFLLAPMIQKLLKNRISGYAVMICLCVITNRFVSLPINFMISSVVHFLTFFLIGVLINLCLGTRLWSFSIRRPHLLAAIAAITIVWCLLLSTDTTYTGLLISLLGILGLYLVSCIPFVQKLFEQPGKYSLQIYLLNGFLLVVSRTAAVSILGLTSPLLIILINMCIDFLLSYLFIKYICARIKVAREIMGMGKM